MNRWSGVLRLALLVAVGFGLHALGVLVPGHAYQRPLSPREVAFVVPGGSLGPKTEGGWRGVSVEAGPTVAQAATTSPEGDASVGYSGASEVLLVLDEERRRILGASLRRSVDTPGHVADVRASEDFWSQFREVDVVDWDVDRVDAVSGATLTCSAVAHAVDAKLRGLSGESVANSSVVALRDLWPFVAGLGGLAFTFLVRGRRRLRFAWQVVLVLGLGFWAGDLVSLALLDGWIRTGVAIPAFGLLFLVLAAFSVPAATGRPFYCAHVCPHGALQEWVGKVIPGRWRRRLTGTPDRALRAIPVALLLFAAIATAARLGVDSAALEAFDAYLLGAAAPAAIGIAVVGLLISCFVPFSYCRYGCATGELLRFVRRRSAGKRRSRAITGRSVWIAFVVVIAVGLALLPPMSERRRDVLAYRALAQFRDALDQHQQRHGSFPSGSLSGGDLSWTLDWTGIRGGPPRNPDTGQRYLRDSLEVDKVFYSSHADGDRYVLEVLVAHGDLVLASVERP